MKRAFASGDTSLDGFGTGSGALSPRLDRLLRRIFQGKPEVTPEARVGKPADAPMTLLSRFDFDSALVAILAPDRPEARQMKADIEDAGGTVMIIPQIDLPEVWLRKYAPLLTCCIVGHDFADADEAIDFCLRLRFVAPDLVTVLTVETIKHHDFSRSRMPACDVTLRRPVSRVPLFLGLQAACDNRAAHDHGRTRTCDADACL